MNDYLYLVIERFDDCEPIPTIAYRTLQAAEATKARNLKILGLPKDSTKKIPFTPNAGHDGRGG